MPVSAESTIPKSWKDAKAPYNQWAVQADAVPQKVLTAAVKKKKAPPKVYSADVKKYGEGRKGDEIGMKIGMKELHTKNKLSENGKVQGEIEREKERKKAMRKQAKIVQAKFNDKERLDKNDIKKAARQPPKPVPPPEKEKQTDVEVQGNREADGRAREAAAILKKIQDDPVE